VTRVPLVPPDDADDITAEVFDVFRREGREPIALYRAIANAPRMLKAYSTLAQGLRHQAQTPRTLRELVILRTAQLVGSDYEWAHHRAMAEKAGVAEEQVRALAAWRDAGELFGGSERAALCCAEEMHELALSDEGFDELERALGREGALEIVLLAAFYQAVARMIQALGLEVEPAYRRYLDREP
jgi:AhpD family alkylhydroperoxidase